jgi:hypothetical protein
VLRTTYHLDSDLIHHRIAAQALHVSSQGMYLGVVLHFVYRKDVLIMIFKECMASWSTPMSPRGQPFTPWSMSMTHVNPDSRAGLPPCIRVATARKPSTSNPTICHIDIFTTDARFVRVKIWVRLFFHRHRSPVIDVSMHSQTPPSLLIPPSCCRREVSERFSRSFTPTRLTLHPPKPAVKARQFH